MINLAIIQPVASPADVDGSRRVLPRLKIAIALFRRRRRRLDRVQARARRRTTLDVRIDCGGAVVQQIRVVPQKVPWRPRRELLGRPLVQTIVIVQRRQLTMRVSHPLRQVIVILVRLLIYHRILFLLELLRCRL